HVAALNGHAEAAQVLINAGANPSAKDKDGITPLDVARRVEEWSVAHVIEAAMR
ncbi:MAG: ankyrin repeat domain-containing protein, partial [Synechococcus sp. SB0675_bin_7]|nr:ankyrin repeat domain-containing protein [Synechococcus sp. SB0675_bin_7]